MILQSELPRTALHGVFKMTGMLAKTALENPKTTAVALGVFAMSDKTFGADGLIISLPCYVGCIAAGALAPLCIAFCTVLP